MYFRRRPLVGSRSNAFYDEESPLTHWRGYTAEMFTEELRCEVWECVAQIGTTIEEWRAAIRGDAAAAIALALRMKMPAEITAPLDVTMTVLLAVALEDVEAASAMADLLQRAPLEPVDRMGLSTSWLVHKIWLESVARNSRGRRSPGA